MIKKLLLTVTIIISGVILLQAQCTPGNYTTPGIYPDTATNLPKAYATIVYAATMTAVIPADTTILVLGSLVTVSIDSIGITGVTGMPTGFTYTPNSAHGSWPGGGKGCILISGTASHAQVGTYNLIINTEAWAGGFAPQYNNINGYRIIIKDSVLGINEINGQPALSLIVSTDPNYNSIIVNVHSLSVVKDASVIINDITGRELMHLNNLNGSDILINKGNLSKGIYIVTLITSEQLIIRKKIIIG
jgi:hypothetical protein